MVTADRLSRARAGDGEAFRELTESHRREPQVHCYRMLGSVADAEDAVQETMLAAWQGIGGFAEERASLRTWLYKIATNRCLNARRAASRRPARQWDGPESGPLAPTPRDEPVWLQPFPDALLATPMFIIFKSLSLLNTFAAVILATTSKTLAFALVILRPMFRQVPIELEEASLVDGCNRFQTFCRIVVPIIQIPLIVVGALSFVQAYGQFVYALTLLSRQELQPATVGIYSFVGAEYADWHRVMAFSSVFVLPILVLFLLLQRRIVAGLTAGALK